MLKQTLVAFAFALAGATTINAAEVAGVKLPDSVKVGSADLQLNGAGVRTRLVVKVYVGALYLAEKKTAAADALAARGAKRITLVMLRDLSAEQLSGALQDGLADNIPAAEREKMAAQLEELRATMAAVGAVKEKNVLTIDYLPESGATRLSLDGTPKGKPIPGEDFYRALMRIWIGDKPVDGSLKSALLGG